MRFKVFLLRRRGRRVPWIEATIEGSFVGEVTMHKIRHGQEDYHVVTLETVGGSPAPSPVPDLYEPVLVHFGQKAIRLRGYERIEDPYGAYGVVQEWHCEKP